MTQKKTLLFEALFFAFGIFAATLMLDWITGKEADYAKRAITAAIATPIYLAMKYWLAKRASKKTDA